MFLWKTLGDTEEDVRAACGFAWKSQNRNTNVLGMFPQGSIHDSVYLPVFDLRRAVREADVFSCAKVLSPSVHYETCAEAS